MRHALAVVLALTACAMLTGVTSLAAVGEWITDAPAHVLEQLGLRPDPVLPRRLAPSESAVRRLLSRIDGDALDRAVGRWLADRRPTRRLRRAARPGRRRQEPARRGQGQGPQDPPARCGRARHRPGPRPARRRRQDERGHPLQAAARHDHRTHRHCRHQRRPAHPARTRRLPPGPAGALHRDRQGQPEAPAQPAQVAAMEGHPAPGPDPGQGPRTLRDPPDQGRHREQPAVPRSPTGHPDQTAANRPQDGEGDHKDDLRSHRPHRRTGRPARACPTNPRPLEHRSAAPRPRHHVRRGRLPATDRQRTPSDGHLLHLRGEGVQDLPALPGLVVRLQPGRPGRRGACVRRGLPRPTGPSPPSPDRCSWPGPRRSGDGRSGWGAGPTPCRPSAHRSAEPRAAPLGTPPTAHPRCAAPGSAAQDWTYLRK